MIGGGAYIFIRHAGDGHLSNLVTLQTCDPTESLLLETFYLICLACVWQNKYPLPDYFKSKSLNSSYPDSSIMGTPQYWPQFLPCNFCWLTDCESLSQLFLIPESCGEACWEGKLKRTAQRGEKSLTFLKSVVSICSWNIQSSFPTNFFWDTGTFRPQDAQIKWDWSVWVNHNVLLSTVHYFLCMVSGHRLCLWFIIRLVVELHEMNCLFFFFFFNKTSILIWEEI